jgi:ribose 5-phosphate isomerase B
MLIKMIAIGSDHGGFALKEEIKKYLEKSNIQFKDYGTCNEQSCDYPVYAEKVCKAVQDGECEKGLLFCGTGIGISMAANRFKGIRAAVCTDYYSAKYTRLHNNANVLCLGGRVIGGGLAAELVDVFLNTEFEGGINHERRVAMLKEIENR